MSVIPISKCIQTPDSSQILIQNFGILAQYPRKFQVLYVNLAKFSIFCNSSSLINLVTSVSFYLLFIMHRNSQVVRNLEQKENQHNKKTIFLANFVKSASNLSTTFVLKEIK